MSEDILVDKQDGCATVTINRPRVHNVLTGEMYQGLADLLLALDREPDVRVIRLTGAGDRAFCAGSDVRAFLDRSVVDRARHFEKVARLMETPSRIAKPVVATVRGYALGGGCALTAACDVAIATEDATLGVPELEVGIFPMTIMPVICRAVGARKAFELLVLGRKLSGAEAARIGLVNVAVPAAEYEQTVDDWIGRLLAFSALQVQMGKQAFYTMLDTEAGKATRFLANVMAISASAADAREGITAFLEKRQPTWRNE